MIPNFEINGNLPPGIHNATLEEVKERFSTNPHRKNLLIGLDKLIDHLKDVGCFLVYLDGSFITNKEYPNDYDLAWSIVGITDDNVLKIDSILLDVNKYRKEMKEKYMGDIFPAEIPEGKTGKTFRDFFQVDKNTGEQKGIIAINLN